MKKSVKAKLEVTSIEILKGGYRKLKLNAVNGNTNENVDYAKYTPSAELNMHISPETPAIDFFNIGDEFYVEFTKV